MTGPSNKLYVADVSGPQHNAQSPNTYAPASDFQQLASASLSLPATKVGWEPPAAGALGGMEEQGGRGELLVTTGDMLRLWELQSAGDERGRGYVGSNGYGANGSGYSLAARSVLTNVSGLNGLQSWDAVAYGATEQGACRQPTTNNVLHVERDIAKIHRDMLHRYHCNSLGHQYISSGNAADRS